MFFSQRWNEVVMKVTLGIIALNEQDNIDNLFENVLNQTFPKSDTEVVLVDGGSTDETKHMMLDFAEKHNEYWHVKVLDNPKRIQPAGWNVVINNAEGDVIIRVDAHAMIPDNFIENNVKCIEGGESVCGGIRNNVIKSDKISKKLLNMAENSMFGSGIASFRRGSSKKYVNTIASACYKKTVFDEVGLFDDRLVRAEDNDMHYRIRKAGYRLCMSDDIHSDYLTRPTLKGMIKQKYGNGKYIGIASIIKTRKMFSLYHFIPLLFVIGLFVVTAMLIPGIVMWDNLWWLCLPFVAAVGAYVLLDVLLSIKSSVSYKQPAGIFVLPFIFPLLHIAYGLGTVAGLLTAGQYKGNPEDEG